jgi:DNA polymerase-3 subunit alpha
VLEPGSALLLTLSAESQGDDVRARIQTAEPLDAAAAKLQKGLRVFLRDPAPLDSVAKRLEGTAPAPAKSATAKSAAAKSDGEVSMILMLGEGTEVEVKLPGRFRVSPQIAGAIKAVPGVVAVEAV